MNSDVKRANIGAVAVYKNKIIGMGYNSYKTHPRQCKYDKYRPLNLSKTSSTLHAIHAEVMCLTSIKKKDIDWSKVELYIFRSKKESYAGLCRPCPACMQLIKDFGIKHIFYTTDESVAYEYLYDAYRIKEFT